MLPRAHRLHLSADLRSVMRRGRRFVLPEAVVFVQKRPGETSRFGVITPKRSGNAVTRHSIARKVRHSWLPVLQSHPDSFAIVVRAESGAANLSVEDWTDATLQAIAKAER